ncbi:hypothetical protein F5876DRAFT_70254 [Lentinula aff. lateritia]|uniref:Uncharacterized protein n=1 Tax=Lentinula aff. lateritia TaxID=2804960 RepID=A0ACC1TJJ9_9AGAR|nr:hypothetical protein F5876DRAFT_70254 [Lentinula aff. lateritia]
MARNFQLEDSDEACEDVFIRSNFTIQDKNRNNEYYTQDQGGRSRQYLYPDVALSCWGNWSSVFLSHARPEHGRPHPFPRGFLDNPSTQARPDCAPASVPDSVTLRIYKSRRRNDRLESPRVGFRKVEDLVTTDHKFALGFVALGCVGGLVMGGRGAMVWAVVWWWCLRVLVLVVESVGVGVGERERERKGKGREGRVGKRRIRSTNTSSLLFRYLLRGVPYVITEHTDPSESSNTLSQTPDSKKNEKIFEYEEKEFMIRPGLEPGTFCETLTLKTNNHVSLVRKFEIFDSGNDRLFIPNSGISQSSKKTEVHRHRLTYITG